MNRKKLSYPNFLTMKQALRETEQYFTELMDKPCTIDRDDFLGFYFDGANKLTIRESLGRAIVSVFKQVADKHPELISQGPNGDMKVINDKPLTPHMHWVITGKLPAEEWKHGQS